MFMAEEEMDRVICADKYLHGQYITSLKEVLLKLSPEVIKSVFEDVYREIHPFYQKEEVLIMSKFDLKGATDPVKFKTDFMAAYQYFIARHTWLTIAL